MRKITRRLEKKGGYKEWRAKWQASPIFLNNIKSNNVIFFIELFWCAIDNISGSFSQMPFLCSLDAEKKVWSLGNESTSAAAQLPWRQHCHLTAAHNAFVLSPLSWMRRQPDWNVKDNVGDNNVGKRRERWSSYARSQLCAAGTEIRYICPLSVWIEPIIGNWYEAYI